tara:strand:+ start:4075 stop:6972 length:2898 start_codon:yes stop_codon:yes gene_type:complete
MKDISFIPPFISGSLWLLLSIIGIYVLGLDPGCLYAQNGNPKEFDLIQGELPNGFRYLIKPIPNENSLKMRFYVKAEESKKDFQLAHLIEHLAFRKSKAFPNGIYNIDSLFNSVGMKGPGRDVYAYSGAELTEYIFNPNPKNYKSVQLGLSWFYDIASGLKLEDQDILIEKKTLHQEHKLRTSGQEHVFVNQSIIDAAIFPCEASFEHYDRKIDSFTTSEIRKFYKAKYRPNNMVLMVVGSIENFEELKIKIEETFKKVKSSYDDREFDREYECKLAYLQQKDQFVVKRKRNLDKERKSKINFNFYYKDEVLLKKSPLTKEESLTRRKQIILWDLIANAMRSQLNNLTQVYNPDYAISVEETATKSSPSAALHLSVDIPAETTETKVALGKVFQQLGWLISNGYEKEQWQETKRKKLNEIASKSHHSLNYWEDKLKNHIINGEFLNADENIIIESWLSNISVSEFNNYLKQFIGHAPNDIGILIPSDFKSKFQNRKLRDLVDKNLMKTEQRVYEKLPEVLLTKNEVRDLEPVHYEKVPDSISKYHYRFSNGIHLILVRDTTRKNSIKLQGFSPVGALDLKSSDFYSATYSPRIVRNSGVGELNKFQLKSILKDLSYLSVVPYITATETGVKAETSTEHTEIMLQLLHLYISNPRHDTIAFLDWQNNASKSVKSPHYDIDRANFNNCIQEYFSAHKTFFSSGNKYLEYSKMVDFEQALKSYHKLFSMSDKFTYIITGDFEEEVVLQLAQKYLGNLPNESYDKENYWLRNQNIEEEYYVHFDNEWSPETEQNDIWYSLQLLREPDNHSWQEVIKFEFLKEVITEMIWKLRFEEGFSLYHINVKGGYHLDLSKYLISIMLQCKPDEFEAIRAKSSMILDEISDGNIPKLTFDKVFDRMKMKYGNNVQQLKSLDRLYLYYNLHKTDDKKNFSFPELGEMSDFFQKLDWNFIVEYTRQFFRENQFFEFSM